uniref:Uncharacterized protein n=1 Tax=Prolemur simus TaxID=1328070 RepID=A0A8C8YWM1_PROSS
MPMQIFVHGESLLPNAGGSPELADPGLQCCVLQFHRGLHGHHQPGGHLLLPIRRGLQWFR